MVRLCASFLNTKIQMFEIMPIMDELCTTCILSRFADWKDRKFHCLLGHLYESAREELRIVGHAFEVNAPKASAPVGLDHADMLPSFAPVCLFKQDGGSTDSGKSSVARKSSSIIETLQYKIEVRSAFY